MTINLLASPVPCQSSGGTRSSPECTPESCNSRGNANSSRTESCSGDSRHCEQPNESLRDRVNGIRALGVLSEGTNTLASLLRRLSKAKPFEHWALSLRLLWQDLHRPR